MQTGYMYLMAIIDLHSRYVLKWSVSNTMAAEWCSRVLSETLATYPTPTIVNTDQGSQFTADVFTALLVKANVQISMDGKGRALDNIFTVRRCGRTPLAGPPVRNGEIGGYLLEGLHRWLGVRGWFTGLLRVLQLSALSSGAGLSNARTGTKGGKKQDKPSGQNNN